MQPEVVELPRALGETRIVLRVWRKSAKGVQLLSPAYDPTRAHVVRSAPGSDDSFIAWRLLGDPTDLMAQPMRVWPYGTGVVVRDLHWAGTGSPRRAPWRVGADPLRGHPLRSRLGPDDRATGHGRRRARADAARPEHPDDRERLVPLPHWRCRGRAAHGQLRHPARTRGWAPRRDPAVPGVGSAPRDLTSYAGSAGSRSSGTSWPGPPTDSGWPIAAPNVPPTLLQGNAPTYPVTLTNLPARAERVRRD